MKSVSVKAIWHSSAEIVEALLRVPLATSLTLSKFQDIPL